jgi:hypothetical protein
MSNEGTLYEKILSENLEKGKQLRLVVSEFRGEQYLHIRYYYLDYEGTWIPTKEGATMPATIESIFALLDGLVDICSKQETTDSITTHFTNIVSRIFKQDEQVNRIPK